MSSPSTASREPAADPAEAGAPSSSKGALWIALIAFLLLVVLILTNMK